MNIRIAIAGLVWLTLAAGLLIQADDKSASFDRRQSDVHRSREPAGLPRCRQQRASGHHARRLAQAAQAHSGRHGAGDGPAPRLVEAAAARCARSTRKRRFREKVTRASRCRTSPTKTIACRRICTCRRAARTTSAGREFWLCIPRARWARESSTMPARNPTAATAKELAQRGIRRAGPRLSVVRRLQRIRFQRRQVRLGNDEGHRQPHPRGRSVAVARRSRSAADRGDRPLAGGAQRHVRGGLRRTHQGDRFELRLDAVSRVLRRQDRRLDERSLHAAT